MAVKCSSSCGNSAMKASLVLMLLFGAVVAAHATHEVEFHNGLCVSVYINDIKVEAGGILKLIINASVHIKVANFLGDVLSTVCTPLGNVTKVKVVKVNHVVKLEMTAVANLSGGVVPEVGSVLCPLLVLTGPCPNY